MKSQPYRILIVEDSPEDRLSYRRRIEQDGDDDFVFWETDSGERGLKLCSEIDPDCILLDYQLPDLDGLEFLDRIRVDEGCSHVPIIMLTGHGNEAVAVSAMKKGANDYLSKSAVSQSLSQVVRSAIEKGILRRQLEEQRREVERLSAERLQLIQQLQQQTVALAEANRRKDEFLAMLGHELRNPLAPVRNALTILRMSPSDIKVVEKVRQMMDRQVGHMSHIIDDLLDVSRIRGGKITLRREHLDLKKLINECVEQHRANFTEASIDLKNESVAKPLWVNADATRLTQVVENLLTNALKFTNAGSSVTISLSISDTQDQAILVVRDSGIGIEPSMLPCVFDTFAQADRTLERSRGGLGLGLALVKGLVESHEGSVTASSDGVGRGAEFTVRLPIANERDDASDRARKTDTTIPSALRVLLIEDNRDAAESLQVCLTFFGLEVSVANSGPKGLSAALKDRPDVVVCDIGLPGMDGYALAKALRADPHGARIKLIALSGYGGEDDRKRAVAAGFDLHLTKPVQIETLIGHFPRRDGKVSPLSTP